ncbi:hypothetical protein DPMN_165168 [Dreissena polymorpha]|uniref:Uncharacterized protein n=1 Tax=Dreissena polymorpha TaxID=45954 RepID=A0A9D4EWL9_DREPO|nr:hypothetical protein DPMN_165168 [Dreissena polymorpha]
MWFLVSILDCQTGIHWGPSITSVDLQGNCPMGIAQNRLKVFLVVTSRMFRVVTLS